MTASWRDDQMAEREQLARHECRRCRNAALDEAAEQIRALVLTWDYDAKPYQKAIDDVLAVLDRMRGDDG